MNGFYLGKGSEIVIKKTKKILRQPEGYAIGAKGGGKRMDLLRHRSRGLSERVGFVFVGGWEG